LVSIFPSYFFVDPVEEELEIIKKEMMNREVEMESDVARYESYVDDLQRKYDRVEKVAEALAGALQREKTSYSIAKKERDVILPRNGLSDDLMEQRLGQAVLELHLALSYLNDAGEINHTSTEQSMSDRAVSITIEDYDEEDDDREEVYAEMLEQIDESYAENGRLYLKVRSLERTLTKAQAVIEQSVVDSHLMFSYANEPVNGSSGLILNLAEGESDLNLVERDVEWEMGVMEYEARIDELVHGNACVVAYYKILVGAWRDCVKEIEELKAVGPELISRSESISNDEQAVVDAHLRMSYRNDHHAELGSDISGAKKRAKMLSQELIRTSRRSHVHIKELMEELARAEEENRALFDYLRISQTETDLITRRYDQAILDAHLAMSYSYSCDGGLPKATNSNTPRNYNNEAHHRKRNSTDSALELKYEHLVCEYNTLVENSQSTVPIDTFEKLMDELEDKAETIAMNEQRLMSYQEDIALLRSKLAEKEMSGISMERRPSANNEIQRQIQAREKEFAAMRAEHELLLDSQTVESPFIVQESTNYVDTEEETILVSKRELERLREDSEKVVALMRTIKESDARLRARDLYLNNSYVTRLY
jgi:hypothetical protein